jgi:hypothetical protein
MGLARAAAALSPWELAAETIAVKKRKRTENPGFSGVFAFSTTPVAPLYPWLRV